jgi:hypothetical protein
MKATVWRNKCFENATVFRTFFGYFDHCCWRICYETQLSFRALRVFKLKFDIWSKFCRSWNLNKLIYAVYLDLDVTKGKNVPKKKIITYQASLIFPLVGIKQIQFKPIGKNWKSLECMKNIKWNCVSIGYFPSIIPHHEAIKHHFGDALI